MLNLPPIAILVTGAIAVVASLLYIREYFLRKKGSSEQQRISMETRQKSFQILRAAEMAETQVIADGNYATKKLLADFTTQLQTLITESAKTLTSSNNQFVKFMEDLQKKSAEFEESSKNIAEQKINQVFDRLENRLSDFLVQTEQKTTSSIELELRAARNLIETYKEQQLKIIDENIVAMMEQTLNIVLAKKLSLKDQLDLVYEALEKAKVEKFVA